MLHPWTLDPLTGEELAPFTTFSIAMIHRQSRGQLPLFVAGLERYKRLAVRGGGVGWGCGQGVAWHPALGAAHGGGGGGGRHARREQHCANTCCTSPPSPVLQPGDRVLIAEACNHNRITADCNDIGCVQVCVMCECVS